MTSAVVVVRFTDERRADAADGADAADDLDPAAAVYGSGEAGYQMVAAQAACKPRRSASQRIDSDAPSVQKNDFRDILGWISGQRIRVIQVSFLVASEHLGPVTAFVLAFGSLGFLWLAGAAQPIQIQGPTSQEGLSDQAFSHEASSGSAIPQGQLALADSDVLNPRDSATNPDALQNGAAGSRRAVAQIPSSAGLSGLTEATRAAEQAEHDGRLGHGDQSQSGEQQSIVAYEHLLDGDGLGQSKLEPQSTGHSEKVGGHPELAPHLRRADLDDQDAWKNLRGLWKLLLRPYPKKSRNAEKGSNAKDSNAEEAGNDEEVGQTEEDGNSEVAGRPQRGRPASRAPSPLASRVSLSSASHASSPQASHGSTSPAPLGSSPLGSSPLSSSPFSSYAPSTASSRESSTRSSGGKVYGFCLEGRPESIKIGCTKDDRLKYWEDHYSKNGQCNVEPQFHVPMPSAASRVEALVHRHLFLYRQVEACQCRSNHKWFKVSVAEAETIVKRWQAFSNSAPYEHTGELEPGWREKVPLGRHKSRQLGTAVKAAAREVGPAALIFKWFDWFLGDVGAPDPLKRYLQEPPSN